MNARFITFKAKQGDCIFLILRDENLSCHIMVDCGSYSDEIKEFVEKDLQKRIDVLVATHIDNDHIDGLVEMLQQTPDLTIGKVIYNCNQLWKGKPLVPTPEDIKNDIQMLENNLPSKQSANGGKIKADKATTFAEILAKNTSWWKAWKKDEYITINTKPIPLGNNFGQLVVLSPTVEDITKLDLEFKIEYNRLTKHIIDHSEYINGQETLFELVERVATMKRVNYQMTIPVKTSAANFPWSIEQIKKAYEYEPTCVSDENTASIALMWEGGDKKILLMGDAEPDEVAAQIEKLYQGTQVNVEAIKVSHHGSKHSTNFRLMKIVDSDNYFFTGGNNSNKPSLEAFMKIVNRQDKRQRTLHFHNFDNIIVKAMSSNQGCSLQKQYHFKMSGKNELRFEY